MTPREFIAGLRSENEAFYSDDRGRGALKDLQVVFPVPWIYLAELVQNAIDAGATRIRFIPAAAAGLIFEHNGKSFSPEDVRALCTRGVSTKSTNTVGFMGVGFKSTFKAYETVVVSSGEWKFRLSVPADEMFGVRQWIGAVLPTWASDASQPHDDHSCRFEFRRRLIDGTPEIDLAELLREGEALLPLLGWNRVTDFQVGEASWRLSAREESIGGGDASRVKVEASSSTGGQRAWMLFVKSYQPSEAAVLRFLQHRQIQPAPEERDAVLSKARRVRDVSLFCEVSGDGSPQPVNRGQCFSLVPTGHTTCLGLHLQADWLLDISRREPMRIANDPWQQEILGQVPYLIRSYLEWLVSDDTDGAQSWDQGYAALPGPGEDAEIDGELRGGATRQLLCSVLKNCAFVPFEREDGRIDFVIPEEARVLPRSLRHVMSGDAPLPANVFGSRIVATDTLGTRALEFLNANTLLRGLSPTELEDEWRSGKLGTWYAQAGESRDAAYVRLIGALAELDSEDAWSEAALPCLPAADGAWRSRAEVKRYPPNWAILSPSPRVVAALEPFVGVAGELLDWKTDQLLRRDAAAQRYLATLSEAPLDQVVSAWWSSLSEDPDQPTRETVLEFTDLVRRQRTLPRLVGKVLANSPVGERLLRIDEVLLTEPYAGDYRRTLFPDLPTVAPVYLASFEGATDADWRAFFESQSPSPKGRPMLMLSRRVATAADLDAVAAVPSLRVTYVRTTWNGLSIDSNAHYAVDAQWPTGVEPSATNASPAHAWALQRSMLEMPAVLKSWRRLSLAYVPRNSSSVSSMTLPNDAAWLLALKKRPWVFDQADQGPYRVADILADSDPSRPTAPVARLVDGFAALASELDIRFGGAIPNAPAIERLRALGPSASWSELQELVQGAASEAGEDQERLALLRSVLAGTPLFAFAEGRQSPDGHRRVAGSRVVNGARRSTLGDWVCSVESFSESGVERQVFKLLQSIVDIPDATTGEHAASFLRWVWSTEPDADRVRQILPRAFQYVLDLPEEAKVELRRVAKVFATSRRWLNAMDTNVYLNDLEVADRDLVAADQGLSLATPGHLGDDEATRRQVAALLGLQFVSARYQIEIAERVGNVVTPNEWSAGFKYAQAEFWRRVAGAHEDEAVSPGTPDPLELLCVEAVTRRLLKAGVELDARESNVAIRDERAHVVGEPLEFAPQLAQALIEHWGVTLRRDGYALGSMLTGLLARIDRGAPGKEFDKPAAAASVDPADVGAPRHDNTVPASGTKATPPVGAGSETPTGSVGGTSTHTIDRKDAQRDWLLKKRQELSQTLKELERQIAEGLGSEVIPLQDDTPDEGPRKSFGDDRDYREAVVNFERQNGRFPKAGDAGQPGYDIDSYSHDVDHPDRALVRRIEVKGKGALWNGDEIVELSDRQLKDALARRVEDGARVAPDFDYWLYVVETCAGAHQVLPIRNPARRAAKFEFRGGVWRVEAEQP